MLYVLRSKQAGAAPPTELLKIVPPIVDGVDFVIGVLRDIPQEAVYTHRIKLLVRNDNFVPVAGTGTVCLRMRITAHGLRQKGSECC